jgi:hypothetical protein
VVFELTAVGFHHQHAALHRTEAAQAWERQSQTAIWPCGQFGTDHDNLTVVHLVSQRHVVTDEIQRFAA